MRRHGIGVVLAAASLAVCVPSVLRAGATAAPYDTAVAFAAAQDAKALSTLAAGRYPSQTSSSGAWATSSASGWTSGFFAGSLWLLHQLTGDPVWRSRAEALQAGLESQKNDTSTHDVGFKVFVPFERAHALTGDDRYRQVLLTAASSLASRYSPVVGSTRSWGGSGDRTFTVIVDNMMNIELLFWAAAHGGDPAWRDMATSHARNTMRDHVRADGSTYQIVDYSPTTGGVVSKSTKQGAAKESTWARGQAWALHGFTSAYRATRDAQLLATAERVADWWIAHVPADRVPYWDFQAPGIPNEPRDSSAAAIAAAGLVELAALEPDPARAQRYRDAAVATLDSLVSPAYLAQGTALASVLQHGTRNKPSGDFDTGLSYGDFYLLQAIARVRGDGSPPPSTTSTSAPTSTTTSTTGPTATVPAGGSLTFTPVADSYVRAGSPSENNGARTTLRVRGGTVVTTYLKFDVRDLAGASLAGARLRLRVADGGPDRGTVRAVADTSWTEAGITYANAPPAGTVVSRGTGPAAAGSTVDVELDPAAVRGDGPVAFAITGAAADAVDYTSRETSTAPQLVLTTGGAGSPTTTSSTTTTTPPTTTSSSTTSTSVPPTGTGRTFAPVADTYVRAGSPSETNGARANLRVRGPSTEVRTFLRFDVAGTVGTVRGAVLRLRVADPSPNAGVVRSVASTTWSEATTSWTAQPAMGPVVGSPIGPAASGTWVEVDVTASVLGDGAVSFAVVDASGSDAVDFVSREGTSPAQLVVTTA